jgi:hypothetical protein
MNISRFLDEGLIDLHFAPEQDPPPEDSNSGKWRARNKEKILSALVDILEVSGKTANRSKLFDAGARFYSGFRPV